MQRFFQPAIALLNRMGYTKKFTLLWLMSLVAIAMLVYALFVSIGLIIRPLQRELEGLALIEPVSRTVQLIQQQRGLSAALLGGNEAMRDRRAAKEREAAEAFKAMEGTLPPGLASNEDFRHIKADWERLRKEGLYLTVEENFAAHTRLIEQIQLFELSIADDYALILDSELCTFYLIDTIINKLPQELEDLGQLRAYGTGILARKQVIEYQKIKLNTLINEQGNTLNKLKIDLDRVARYNPVLQSKTSAAFKDIAYSTQQIASLVTLDIFTGHFATPPDVFLDMTTAAIDQGYAQMYQVLLPTTKTLIEARIAHAKKVLFTSTGFAFLLLLLVIYITVSIYYAIVSNIQSLVSSARIFAGGDLSERIKLSTRDELSYVGDSFNEMADGFNALLEARREDEACLRATVENAMDAVVQMNAEGIIIGWNIQAEKIFGWTSEEAVGRVLHETIIPPQHREAHVRGLKYFLLSGEGPILNSRIEIVGLHRDGHEFPIELAIAPIKMAGKYEFSAFIRDVTERKQAEEESAKKAEDLRIAAIAFETQAAIVITDLTPKILRVNRAFEEITGYTAAEVIGHDPKILSAPEIRESKAFYEEMWADLVSKGKWSGEVLDKRKNGVIYPKWLTITAVTTTDGTATHYVGSFFDIVERKKAEEDIHRFAFYDSLTNLPNRRLLLDRLQHALETSARSCNYGAILFLDLDNFKVINDTKGHDLGDLLLIEVAQRLQSCVRKGDTVARLGGDEFVVVLEDIMGDAEQAAAQVEEVAEKIRYELSKTYLLEEHEYRSTASIGINMFADREISAENLLKHADIAMYQAKENGRNIIRFFDPEMQAVLELRTAMEADLHRAIVGQQFRFYYQAQVDNDGRILGAEALIRWIHPQRGMVPPFQFIPIAEESSLILDIGQWGLETACRQLALWGNDEQKCNLVLAVNVSARQFKLSDFVDKVAAVIKEHRINPSRLKLELTESVVLVDVADIVTKMHALKALGVGLSMDDFGTGYSSLSYLKQLPLDQLKIDRSFVNDIATDPNDAIMVRTIIDMAHNFRLNVIAEGVETEAQLAFLKQHGCMMYQGYLFSKPVPIEEFDKLIAQQV